MNYDYTLEERLTLENLRLKRQLVESETRSFMAGLLRKHAIPEDAMVTFTETHLVVKNGEESPDGQHPE